MTWSDANFDRHQLHVRGDPVTATKNGETRYVPMIPELEQMLSELRKERPTEPASSAIMRVFGRYQRRPLLRRSATSDHSGYHSKRKCDELGSKPVPPPSDTHRRVARRKHYAELIAGTVRPGFRNLALHLMNRIDKFSFMETFTSGVVFYEPLT